MLLAWGVDLPYWDGWSFAELVDRAASGRLHVGDLTAPANEHRIAVPRLILLGLARITGWNVRAELLASVAIVLLGLVAVDRLVRRLALSPGARWTTLALGSAFLFSPAQADNWAWGYQVLVFTCCTASLWSIVLVTRPRLGAGAVAGAVASGWIATFSFGAGLAVWPLGVLGMLRRTPAPRRALAAWCAAGAAAVLAFSWGHPGPTDPATDAGDSPTALVPYALAVLGAPAVPAGAGAIAAQLAAILGLAVWATALWRLAPARSGGVRGGPEAEPDVEKGEPTASATPRLAGALLLLLLALAVALLVAWGRAGRADAASGRYLTLATPFWLSVLLAGAAAVRSIDLPRARSAAGGAATVLAAGLLVLAAIPGVRTLEGQRHARSLVRAQLLAGDIHPVALEVAYPDLDPLQHWATRLCELRLGIFRDVSGPEGCRICWIPSALPPGDPVRTETAANGAPTLQLGSGRTLPLLRPDSLRGAVRRFERADGGVELRGWAATAERSHPASRVVALGPERWIPQRYTRTTRRTLARERGDRCLENAGFRIELLGDADPEQLRVFAIFPHYAAELSPAATRPGSR